MKPLDYEHLLKEAKVHFSRSSGKGGQNVNKLETKVELVLNIPESQVLDPATKALLMSSLHNKIDHEGNLHITESSERQQHLNRVKAEQKLITLIKKSLKPKKKRVPTAPTAASKFIRLFSKRKQSAKKKERRKAISTD